MEILVAKRIGFCFGVSRAIQEVKTILEQYKEVYIYGELVHNNEVMNELKELRAKLRMCNNILEDAERIQIRYNRVLELEEEAERQNKYRNKNQIMR